jgi:MoxR-like ATPase
MDGAQPQLTAERAVGALQRVHAEIDRAVRTPPGLIGHLLTALVGEGHILLEDVPGVGKTALARALARAVGVDFARIQCTPDLLPGDITGVEVFDQRDHEFHFRPGPIFANLLLVDEANRASPKTQAALLEAMQERQVTVDGTSHRIAAPFMVIATQNPIEFEGTFPLPEAQLDRFAMLLSLGYPSREDEVRLLAESAAGDPVEAVAPVADVDELRSAIRLARELHVDAAVNEFAVGILSRTRDDPRLSLGASPRAGVATMRMARARALLAGRDYATPADVADVAPLVLAHRVVPSAEARAQGAAPVDVIADIVARTPLPL